MLKKGVRARVSCSRLCSVALTAEVAPGAARRLGFSKKPKKPVVIGRKEVSGVTGEVPVWIPVRGKARKGLKQLSGTIRIKVRATATATDGPAASPRAASAVVKAAKKR